MSRFLEVAQIPDVMSYLQVEPFPFSNHNIWMVVPDYKS